MTGIGPMHAEGEKWRTGNPTLQRTGGTKPLRCLSFDVEEYFHIEAAAGVIRREEWNNWPSRVERNVERILELLNRYRRRATFFVLGDVAAKHPQMVRRMAQEGHEIASHGMMHDRLHRLDARAFREEIEGCKKMLEDQSQQAVLGYRAPTFSLVPQTAWAIDVLAELGFVYDSSIFPVRHPWYGVPGAPREPFYVQGVGGARILEVPPLVWHVAGRNVAVAGGGYFRLLPAWFMRAGLRQAEREGRPAVLYFHPWEFDPQMPRMPLSLTGRIRTYMGLRRSLARLEKLVRKTARWQTIAESLEEMRKMAEGREAVVLSCQ